MRIFSTLCLLLALPLGCFAYWGLETIDGQHAYDEMAGIVPFAAGVLSGLLALVGALAGWLGTRRARQLP